MAKYGYARVSTIDQNLDLQIDALVKAGVHRQNIYTEKESGKNDDRKALNELLDLLQAGDELVVYKIDRLGRRAAKLITLMDEFKKRQIEFISLQDNIDTNTSVGKALFSIMAILAEMERDIIAERTVAGLQAARERGKRLGRPPVEKEKILRAKKLIASGFTRTEICEMLQISRMTLYRYLTAEEEVQ